MAATSSKIGEEAMNVTPWLCVLAIGVGAFFVGKYLQGKEQKRRSKHWIPPVVALLFAGIASAQCTKPVITGTTATSDATGQQLTVTWTTNVPADSQVGYGEPNITTLTPISDGKAFSQQYYWGANYVWWRWPKNCPN